jgi:hypothetical protein
LTYSIHQSSTVSSDLEGLLGDRVSGDDDLRVCTAHFVCEGEDVKELGEEFTELVTQKRKSKLDLRSLLYIT